jgi:hypothetical protein
MLVGVVVRRPEHALHRDVGGHLVRRIRHPELATVFLPAEDDEARIAELFEQLDALLLYFRVVHRGGS